MFNKEILATFKKHLEGIDKTQNESIPSNPIYKTHKIKQFGEDMKSANEFIGALQILDIALSKIITQAEKLIAEEDFIDKDFIENNLLIEIKSIIQNCTFLSTPLFDTTLSISCDGEEIELEAFSPLLYTNNGGYKNMLAYLEDKKAEVQNTLLKVSEKISNQKVFKSQKSDSLNYNNFDPKDFLKMF